MLATTINVNFRDEKGKTSVTKIRVPSSFTFAQYIEFAQAAAQILSNMSTAQITSVSISVSLDLSSASLRTVATQFSDVFQKALLVARSAISGLFARFNIPTYDEINTLAGSDVLDPVDADVLALVTLLEDGLDDGGIFIVPVDARDNDLETVTLAVEKFRAS